MKKIFFCTKTGTLTFKANLSLCKNMISVARVMFAGLISYGDTVVEFHTVILTKLGLYSDNALLSLVKVVHA